MVNGVVQQIWEKTQVAHNGFPKIISVAIEVCLCKEYIDLTDQTFLDLKREVRHDNNMRKNGTKSEVWAHFL